MYFSVICRDIWPDDFTTSRIVDRAYEKSSAAPSIIDSSWRDFDTISMTSRRYWNKIICWLPPCLFRDSIIVFQFKSSLRNVTSDGFECSRNGVWRKRWRLRKSLGVWLNPFAVKIPSEKVCKFWRFFLLQLVVLFNVQCKSTCCLLVRHDSCKSITLLYHKNAVFDNVR